MWGFQSDIISPMRESFVARSGPETMIVNLNVMRAKGIPGGDPVTKLSNPFLEISCPQVIWFWRTKTRGSNKTSTVDPSGTLMKGFNSV